MAYNRQKENKPSRVPVSGIRDIMTVLGKDENYAYRWIEDVDERGSRIMRFKRGGWDFARNDQDGLMVGSESVYKTKQDGSIVRQMSGDGRYSYLVRIRKEFYDEDQAEKQSEIDAVEETIVGTGTSSGEDFGQYGKVKITRD